jgi:hypothetical protein
VGREEDTNVVSVYLALKAHHRHNNPPSTMLAIIPVMLTTIHPMNNSYNSIVYVPSMRQMHSVSLAQALSWQEKDPASFGAEPLLRASRVPVLPARPCAFPVATFRYACTTLCIHRCHSRFLSAMG